MSALLPRRFGRASCRAPWARNYCPPRAVISSKCWVELRYVSNMLHPKKRERTIERGRRGYFSCSTVVASASQACCRLVGIAREPCLIASDAKGLCRHSMSLKMSARESECRRHGLYLHRDDNAHGRNLHMSSDRHRNNNSSTLLNRRWLPRHSSSAPVADGSRLAQPCQPPRMSAKLCQPTSQLRHQHAIAAAPGFEPPTRAKGLKRRRVAAVRAAGASSIRTP